MSQEIAVNHVLQEAEITLTQFFGGVERGVCVQVTAPSSLQGEPHQFVQLTATEARALSNALASWAASQE